jgi:hypothetical protein
MIETEAFRIFIRIYSLFKIKRLSANIKLTLHKAIIRSVLTYACPAWEFAADSHLLKLQRLQNRVLRSTGNFLRLTSVRESVYRMFMIIKQNYPGNKQKSFKIMKMQMFAILDKAKPDTRNTRGSNLAAVKRTTVQVTRLRL